MKTGCANLSSRFKDFRYALFYALITRHNCKMLTLGDECQWTIQAGSIGEDSVVYSAGVGADISFEKGLSRRFGCHVILLDPSPTGIATMQRAENRITKLHFEPIGLADSDGTFSFDAPDNDKEGSYRIGAPSGSNYNLRCLSLPTLMERYGHNHIDLLKIDIEGFEYGVLRQICEQNLAVKQICVEFHHAIIPGIGRSQTLKAIVNLFRAGYRLIYRNGWDHTFVKREDRLESLPTSP